MSVHDDDTTVESLDGGILVAEVPNDGRDEEVAREFLREVAERS